MCSPDSIPYNSILKISFNGTDIRNGHFSSINIEAPNSCREKVKFDQIQYAFYYIENEKNHNALTYINLNWFFSFHFLKLMREELLYSMSEWLVLF